MQGDSDRKKQQDRQAVYDLAMEAVEKFDVAKSLADVRPAFSLLADAVRKLNTLVKNHCQ
jgi:hypothetical protein